MFKGINLKCGSINRSLHYDIGRLSYDTFIASLLSKYWLPYCWFIQFSLLGILDATKNEHEDFSDNQRLSNQIKNTHINDFSRNDNSVKIKNRSGFYRIATVLYIDYMYILSKKKRWKSYEQWVRWRAGVNKRFTSRADFLTTTDIYKMGGIKRNILMWCEMPNL